MSFSDYMLTVPPWLRMLLTIGISVVITVAVVKVFHPRILRLNAPPPEPDEGDDTPKPPAIDYLSGRLIALSTFAFVFLLAFAFSQFWATAKDARAAVSSEATDFARAAALTRELPADVATPLLSELDGYRASVIDVEWPLMQHADTAALQAVRFAAAEKLAGALLVADQGGGSKAPEWSELSDSVNSLLSDSLDRTNALPSPNAVAILWLVGILGVANLAFVIAFQPAALRPNLVIAGFLAALTAFLMFVLVEVSNPYVGGAAVTTSLSSVSVAPAG